MIQSCLRYKIHIIFLLLLATHIFFRFYLLFDRANFGWDQVDNAWAAKSIIVDKQLLLQGPVAKGNSGIYVGPLYYYLIAPFYFFTNLDPIASPIFASTMSIVSFLILFYVTKKIFGTHIALIAIFINTFSLFVINSDRTQDNFILIVPISYLVFYFLYKVVGGEGKYIILLAIATGLAFHVHFTSIFYLIIILLALPFFPKNRKTAYYILLSIPVFLIFLLPSVFADVQSRNSVSNNLVAYLHTYFHGFHLRRVLQLAHDAFISLEQILQFGIFRPFVFLFLPFFTGIYYFMNPKKERLLLPYLMLLWIVIPWLVLATYRGELTDYYFSLPRNIFIAILAFLVVFLYQRKLLVIKLILIFLLGFYVINNTKQFFNMPSGNLIPIENSVKEAIVRKEVIPFKDKEAGSYVYYVYKQMKKKR